MMKRMCGALATAALAVAALAGPAEAAEEESVTLQMQSVYPGSFPIVGETGKSLGERVKLLSGGTLDIEFHEPGAIVPAGEAWDAVSIGGVDAAWYSPGFAQGVIPSAAMFTAVPFGPRAPEYLAWYYYGGGKDLWREIAGKHNIVSILCTTLPPEASGWFREEITSVDQLKGMKMRIFGLGARVMEKLGAQAQTLPVGDTVPALELGTIDAAEVSMPSLDLGLGMQQYADHYYFPGWHQQTSLFSLIVNKDVWDGLSERQQAIVNEVCRASVTDSIARGEATQFDAMQTLKEKGVTLHRWPDEILDAYRQAWSEVAAEMAENDADFARVWESYKTFRKNYQIWESMGYLD
ncbi:TRAP transporter substrate-binding protein [Ferruginivarius sediminum]|nr:TRAP transporter substrate-binding protein [Ferruginivarius sediminum]